MLAINKSICKCKLQVIKKLVRTYSKLVDKIHNFAINASTKDNIAIIDNLYSNSLSYQKLFEQSIILSNYFKNSIPNQNDIKSVSAYCNSERSYVITLLATWIWGKKFIPINTNYPLKEIEFIVKDCSVGIMVYNSIDNRINDRDNILQNLKTNNHVISLDINSILNNSTDSDIINSFSSSNDANQLSPALVLYTSGTTGRPKGVLHTHSSLEHGIESLVLSWEYTMNDYILHFLPLHHLHGVLNKLLCVLWVGGTIEFLPSANSNQIWNRLCKITEKKVTLFMAVPTIYTKLLESSKSLDSNVLLPALNTLKNMRLHVSGSAPLPDIVMNNWEILTSHVLLERYGMTEICMALSNPYRTTTTLKRLGGSVGLTLPYVECKIVDEIGQEIKEFDQPGELLIKGKTLFQEYLGLPQETSKAFDKNGWFKTGDIAQVNQNGYYKLLGRNSTDIIKSSGYKLSALEIEREILSHPQVYEVAVLGVPDKIKGEEVIAIISLRIIEDSHKFPKITTENAKDTLNLFLDDKLAYYKRPRKVFIVTELPRNHMGKVNKKTILKDLNIIIDSTL